MLLVLVALSALGFFVYDRAPAWWESFERYRRHRNVAAALQNKFIVPSKDTVSIEDAIRAVKQSSVTRAFPAGLPIYVDPIGLQEAECNLAADVTADLGDATVAQVLDRILKPKGLAYWLPDDRYLLITSQESLDVPISP